MIKRTSVDDLPKPLARLVALLRKGGGTAMHIAGRMKCSKPTVYARIRALQDHGYVVYSEKVREGLKGPEAESFSLRAR